MSRQALLVGYHPNENVSCGVFSMRTMKDFLTYILEHKKTYSICPMHATSAEARRK